MIRVFTLETPSGIQDLVEITDEQGNATQMLKSTYDEMIAARPNL